MALHYLTLDGCPCPKPLYPILKKLKAETGCTFESIYRGDDALALLHANGKHSQREIADATPAERAAWGILGTPNPAGQSTHELFSDGVAYKGPVGRKLRWWQCGIDVDDAHIEVVMHAAARHGWKLKHPYRAGVEFHHLNFAKRPRRWRAFFRHVFGKPKIAVAPAKVAAKPHKPVDHLGDAIDVFGAQGSVDWKKVGRKVKVGFCKATEGTTFTDPTFSGARLKEMQANVRTGVYHFARPDNNSAASEVKHFVHTVQAAGGKFISYADWKAGKTGIVGVLDFETAPYEPRWAADWGRKFKEATGVEALIYGGGYSLNPVLTALPRFAGVWIAAYASDWHTYFAGLKKQVVFWQDRDNWRCPGVSGNVDHSRYLKGSK